MSTAEEEERALELQEEVAIKGGSRSELRDGEGRRAPLPSYINIMILII